MPEAPELEAVKDFLNERIVGLSVLSAKVPRPGVLRPLAGDLASDIVGRTVARVSRRAKFLVIGLSGDRLLVINPMLAGALQYCEPSARILKSTFMVLSLSDSHELRYLDRRQMGRVYYVTEGQAGQIPQFEALGPDVLEDISFEEFRRRLSRYHGEIKGILTRGRVVSGIGNAYADEILFAARIYPFRRRKHISEEELRRLHVHSRRVVEEAVGVVRERMGENIHVKVRDFLKVHNKGGNPCPRCGSAISEITANRRITSYCRRCQPGMLLAR